MNDEIKFYFDGMYFTWDNEKEKANLQKHKISFETAAWAFFDPFLVDLHDKDHDEDEPRRNIIARPPSTVNVIFVVYVERVSFDDRDLIRIISARKANGKEKKLYEQNLSR